MTDSDRAILKRIQDYADEVMPDIDPEKVRVSEQIDKLRPILQQIAIEESMPVEDVFIKYMDLATEHAIEFEQKMQDDFGDLMSPV